MYLGWGWGYRKGAQNFKEPFIDPHRADGRPLFSEIFRKVFWMGSTEGRANTAPYRCGVGLHSQGEHKLGRVLFQPPGPSCPSGRDSRCLHTCPHPPAEFS